MKFLEYLKLNADRVNGKITEEQAQNIVKAMEELGMNVLVDDTKSPGYFPKDRYDSVNTRNKELTTQINDLKKVVDEYETLKPQLEAMKSAAGENPLLKQQLEDLQKKIAEYPTKIDELQKQNSEWENKYKESNLTTAIKLAALNAKAKDPSDVLAFIDKSKLQLNEDGTIKGLDEQLKTLTESKSYLFGETIPGSSGNNPPGGGGGNVPKDESKMTDAEWWSARTK